MKHLGIILFSVLAIFLHSCVGDDFIEDRIDPVLSITNPFTSAAMDTLIQLEYSFRNNIGLEEEIEVQWDSEDENIAIVSPTGILEGVNMGSTTIYLRATYEGESLEDSFTIMINEETVVEEMAEERTGRIEPSSFYTLDGNFTLSENDGVLILSFESNYIADDGLPGLYVYLTNNPNSTNGALEIGKVTQFSGAHEYEIQEADLFEYSHVLYFCKPFNVKVGDGTISE